MEKRRFSSISAETSKRVYWGSDTSNDLPTRRFLQHTVGTNRGPATASPCTTWWPYDKQRWFYSLNCKDQWPRSPNKYLTVQPESHPQHAHMGMRIESTSSYTMACGNRDHWTKVQDFLPNSKFGNRKKFPILAIEIVKIKLDLIIHFNFYP